MQAFSVILLAGLLFGALVLAAVFVLIGLLWARARDLAARLRDLEDAVRRLQDEPPAPASRGAASTDIRR